MAAENTTPNLFNGNLTLTIPIGGSYPVGGDLSYGLTLVYNALVWDTAAEEAPVASPIWNAGMGWMVTLGMLLPPGTILGDFENRWTYIGPDGAKHRFFDDLHFGVDDDSCAAQSFTDGRGTIMRLDVSGLPPGAGGPPPVGTIAPVDNPFPMTPGVGPLVWAHGLRNPFRFDVDPVTGRLYVADVGLGTWEVRDRHTVLAVVDAALQAGYRFFDTAQVE